MRDERPLVRRARPTVAGRPDGPARRLVAVRLLVVCRVGCRGVALARCVVDRCTDGEEPKGLVTGTAHPSSTSRSKSSRSSPGLICIRPGLRRVAGLVGPRMSLEANVVADGDRRESQVGVLRGPRDRAVVPVLQRCTLEVETLRLRSDVLDCQESLTHTPCHVDTAQGTVAVSSARCHCLTGCVAIRVDMHAHACEFRRGNATPPLVPVMVSRTRGSFEVVR